MHALRLLVVVVLGLCASPLRAQDASAPPSPAKPGLRLGDALRPLRYAIDMTLVPTSETFSGRVEIDLEIAQPTAVAWLNATDIRISSAAIGDQAGRVVPGDDDVVGLAFDPPLEPGKARLALEYEVRLPVDQDDGVYRKLEEGEWYVFTQFEATDARRAFPCFDEPAFKVPWQLTLHVKREHRAFSNAPVESEAEEPQGMKAVRFAETKPMPSYLLALAVGPFEVVDAGKAGRAGTPIRIVVPRGKSAEARYAAESTGRILEILERYFGTAYPYEKLDSIAVAQKSGAMENPGLVTYGQSIILAKPEEDTVSRQRRYAGICAHELAHMWFGDLVTMTWWDDIWLNEAFATWMARKAVDEWKPEWGGEVSRVTTRGRAMSSDSLVSARRIRQPIESHHDIQNAFDGITYDKGASVLFMFESWLGEKKLRRGIRRYLARHAWGNATAADFLAAVSAEAGFDVAPAFSTFLDQPGVPLVTATLECPEDGRPAVKLRQERYLPAGSQGSHDHAWQIPACVRWGGEASGEGKVCQLMRGPTATITLPSGKKGCPDWILANAGGVGYYRASQDPSPLSAGRGAGASLTLPELVSLLGDTRALVESGDVPAAEALGLVPRLASEDDRHVQAALVGIASSIDEHLVPDDLRPAYERFVRSTFGERARSLGLQSRPGDDEDTQLLRRELIEFVGSTGEDEEITREAGILARQWLSDRGSVDPEMVDVLLALAAENGDRAFFDRLHAEAGKTQDRKHRGRLLSAMASFEDPAIVKDALAIVLTEEFDVREAMTLFWGALGTRQTRDLAYAFFLEHHDAIAARLPRDGRARMIRVGNTWCDEAHRAEIARYFEARAADMPGGPRTLAQVLERMDLCVARKAAQQPSVSAFLREW